MSNSSTTLTRSNSNTKANSNSNIPTSGNASTAKKRSKLVRRPKQGNSSQDESPLPQSSDCDRPSVTSYDNYDRSTQQLEMAANFLNKVQALHYVLENDMMACDAKWTLFVAAALSYRYDIQLKPQPPRFTDMNNGCNINALTSVINDTPKLRVVMQNINEKNYDDLDIEVIELLHWVLVEMKEFNLRSIEPSDVETLIQSIDGKAKLVRPIHAFEVVTPLGFHPDEEFLERTTDKPIKLAFYGNKLHTFYSIINNGFRWETAHNQIFKLTNDFETSLQFSPPSPGWGASLCGPMISCTALCDFAYNGDYVTVTGSNNSGKKHCVNIDVASPDLLRIRYLFFHGCVMSKEIQHKPGFLSWCSRHKYSLSLLSYLLLMVSIGLTNSNNGATFKTFVAKHVQNVLEFCKRMVVVD